MAFPNCTACSRAVVGEYSLADDNGRFAFIESVCANSDVLAHLSGVTALTAGLDDLDILACESEDEDGW